MKGSGLFGWCLSDMSKEQHALCAVTIDAYGVGATCTCPCHTDDTWLEQHFSNTPTKQKRKRKK